MRIFSLVALLLMVLFPWETHASVNDLPKLSLSGIGSLEIQLTGPESTPDTIGRWTLVRPGNQRVEGDDKRFTFDELNGGMYTFSTSLPQGTSASIEVLMNGKSIEIVDRPQVSFPMNDEDRFVLKVQYTYTRTGIVAVNSSPSGLSFLLKGPNDSALRGVTPASFESVPEGQYAVYFDEIDGCPSVPAQSNKLEKGSRITLSVDIVCENLPEDIGIVDPQKTLEFVSVSVGGKTVVFDDVRTADWFAPYVYTVAKAAIITGYTDRSGLPEGTFGPGDHVTVAQLSKIAHKVAGIDETKIRVPVANMRAKNQWFEPYFASAENRHWELWRDRRIDPARHAKRGEVIGTILRVLNIRTVWAEGKTFGDVHPTHKFANAIETAAVDGLIDAGGNFRPDDPINRAEMAKIIANAVDLYIEDTAEQVGGSR